MLQYQLELYTVFLDEGIQATWLESIIDLGGGEIQDFFREGAALEGHPHEKKRQTKGCNP